MVPRRLKAVRHPIPLGLTAPNRCLADVCDFGTTDCLFFLKGGTRQLRSTRMRRPSTAPTQRLSALQLYLASTALSPASSRTGDVEATSTAASHLCDVGCLRAPRHYPTPLSIYTRPPLSIADCHPESLMSGPRPRPCPCLRASTFGLLIKIILRPLLSTSTHRARPVPVRTRGCRFS